MFFGAFNFIPSAKNARAAGNTYYVDQATGDDGHPGTEAEPWLTIQHAADSVVAGDTAYIKNGTYREDINFHISGTAENRITFSAYSGHSPVINGAYTATGWSVYSGNVYQATYNYSGTSLWEDTTNKLTRQANLVSVDAAGEWYLDDAGNTLYVWSSDSVDPGTHTIEVGVSGIGALSAGNTIGTSTSDLDYNTFIGLKTIHAHNDGINFHGDCDSLIFVNMTSEDNGYDGFSLHETSNATVTNLTVNRNGKCNIANVGDSYVSINGLTQTEGTYGPDTAANILFITNASADITNANISQGAHPSMYPFYPLTAGVVNISDSTITGSGTGTVNTQEHTTFNRVIIDGGGGGYTIRATVDSGDRVLIRNSIIRNIGTYGIYAITDNTQVRVENSLVIGQSVGNAFYAYAAGSNIDVYNTIVANNPLRTFTKLNGTINEDYNVLWNSGGYTAGITPGVHTISDDPDFINYTGGNYHLQLTSPAIDSGISTYSPTTDRDVKQKYDYPDIANTGAGALTYYDRGPYEYVLPPDPTFTSTSHPSHVIWYASPAVNMTLSSNGSTTTNYRYLVSAEAAPDKTAVQAGTFDADGTFNTTIPSDGQQYIHTIAVNLDNEPSTNYYSYLVRIDTTAPTISDISPSSGQSVSGTTSISATVSDASSGVASVKFYIDDTLKETDTSSPYSYSWDTTSYTNGSHTIKLVATDNVGNESQSSVVATVATPSPTPTPTTTAASSSTTTSTDETSTATASTSHPWWWYLFHGTGGTTAATSLESFTTSPTDLSTIEPDQEIIFDASSLGSNITSYTWNFGDGNTSDKKTISHKYEAPGRYTVTLTTTDKSGKTSTYTKTIDIHPLAPTISDIKADGTSIVITGKSFAQTAVNLSIHSNPYTGQAIANKDGKFSYTLDNASETLGEGDHTILANAAVILADNTQIISKDSKTYDFKVSVDNGKLKVEMKKTKTWEIVSIILGGVIIIGIGVVVVRRKRKGTRRVLATE